MADIWPWPRIPAPWAAATVAGGALLAAVILITAAVQINRSASLEVAPRIPAPDIPPETFAELVRAIQSSPKEATLIALFAGLATGLYPELLTAARRFTRLR